MLGGERGRLALAKLALQDTNLLLLDEPTNHLDIPSQEILEAVLDDYAGTILLVTHDRYLVDAIATQIWEIAPQTSEVLKTSEVLTVFKGTYSQMKDEREKEAARLLEGVQSLPTLEDRKKVRRRASNGDNKSSDLVKAERRRTAQLQELENQIAILERQLAELSLKLENPPSDPAKVAKLGREYESVQWQMDEKLGEWEGLQN
jgi:ATP-binding cassette subfamily F protein 3